MKETFRDGAFETNSSTSHTLTFKNVKDYKTVKKMKRARLLTVDEFFGEHKTAEEKFNLILTDGYLVNYGYRKISYPVMKRILEEINSRFNKELKIDFSQMVDPEFIIEWDEYSDGCAASIIDFNEFRDVNIDKVNTVNIKEKFQREIEKNFLFPNEEKFEKDKAYEIDMDYKSSFEWLYNIDMLTEFIVNDSFTITTD